MIGSLRGQVLDRDPMIDRSTLPEVLIEVSGIGYRVLVTASTLDRLPTGDEVLLYIHHHIRESDQRLYGFLVKDERVAFEGLLAAHGVGPALAMAVLATHPAAELARILADDDLQALCEVPGVGKKTAQRLLVELKSSLVLPVLDAPNGSAGLANGNGVGSIPSPLADVREALTNLGYSSEEIRRALTGLSVDLDESAHESGHLLKLALQVMARG